MKWSRRNIFQLRCCVFPRAQRTQNTIPSRASSGVARETSSSRTAKMPSATPSIVASTPRHPNADIIDALYKPLRQHKSDNDIREIRVILIETVPQADAADQRIVCTLCTTTVARAQRLSYFALSYVWGDEHDTLPMVVNGLTFHATRNLVEALRHVTVVEPLCCNGIWVDAVCINQTDNYEKSAQVAMMKDIYSGAYETLAWLGPGDTESHAALRLVDRIWRDNDAMGQDSSSSGTEPRKPPRPDLLATPDVLEMAEQLGTVCLFDADVFTGRRYWSRMWTLQESVLGMRVRLISGTDYCFRHAAFDLLEWAMSSAVLAFTGRGPPSGDENAALRRVWQMVSDIQESAENETPFSRQRHVYRMANGMRKPNGRSYTSATRAVACLEAATLRSAWDARDMIFGLCGLVDLGVAVDYNVTARDLYCRVAASLATQLGSSDGDKDMFRILGYAGLASQHSKLGLPTWVPDWSISPFQYVVYNPNAPSIVPPSYVPCVADAGLTLRLRGVFVGRITSTAEPGIYPGMLGTKYKGTAATVSDQLVRIAAVAEYLANMRPDAIVDAIVAAPQLPADELGHPRLPATSLAITLVELLADPFRPRRYEDKIRDVVSLLHCFVATGHVSLPKSSGDQDPDPGNNPGDEIVKAVLDESRTAPLDRDALLREAAYKFQQPTFHSAFLGDVLSFMSNYVYFRTTNGHPGYSADGVQPGDVVYMVAGSQDLMVFRPAGNHFRYLAMGRVVGIGGSHTMNWDNPPGEIEIIDVK